MNTNPYTSDYLVARNSIKKVDIEYKKITEENSIDVKETPFDSEPLMMPTINQTINNRSPNIETLEITRSSKNKTPLRDNRRDSLMEKQKVDQMINELERSRDGLKGSFSDILKISAR